MKHVGRLNGRNGNGNGYAETDLLKELVENHFSMGPVKYAGRLSTGIMFTAKDLIASNQERFALRVDNAILFASTFRDVNEFNALANLPQPPVENYATIGLYLYLADAFSRLAPHTTFLTELRKKNVGLHHGDEPDPEKLLREISNVLYESGLGDDQQRVLEQWAREKKYTIAGREHYFATAPVVDGQVEIEGKKYPIKDGAVVGFESDEIAAYVTNDGTMVEVAKGEYVKLAREVCMRQKFFGMNLPISFALGIKPDMGKLKTDEEAILLIREILQMTQEAKRTGGPDVVEECLNDGNLQREERIYEAVRKVDIASPLERSRMVKENSAEEEKISRGMLEFFPKEALGLLKAKDFDIVYSNSPSIWPIFPEGPIPGLTKKGLQETIRSKGAVLPGFNIIFVADGIRKNPSPPSREEENSMPPEKVKEYYSKHQVLPYENNAERNVVLAQTVLHEVFHLAFAGLSQDEKHKLVEMTLAVSKEVRETPEFGQQKLTSIDTNTLNQVLNNQSDYYFSYRIKPAENVLKAAKDANQPPPPDLPGTSPEEVMCNLYGLMHNSELAGVLPEASVNIRKALVPLMKSLDEAVEKAYNEANKAKPTVSIPYRT